jgi:parallel beta helix pectate lyase-like protein
MAFRATWLLLGSLMAVAGPPPGRIRHVPGDYRTIQAAIDSSAAGDTVLVAPGRYLENIRFGGKGIVVASEYLVTRDPRVITRTVIDGSRPRHPDTASVVLFTDEEDSTSVLSGFTLTGGKGTVWTDARQKAPYREGGGVLCELSSPIIEHNVIEDNQAIEVAAAAGVLSAGGGGIRCGYAEPIIRNNVIRRNQGHYGAGLVLYHSAGTVRNNLIVGNRGGAGFGGSGIWVVGRLSYRLPNLIEQNTIAGNIAVLPDTTPGGLAGKGGGLTIYAPAVLRNNIVWGNHQAVGGPIDRSKRRPTTADHNLIEGGFPGTGNLDADPRFADTVRYYLAPGSPAIDAGDPASASDPGAGATARRPALGHRRADLGAYGGAGSVVLLP